jgi:hypothetical protein
MEHPRHPEGPQPPNESAIQITEEEQSMLEAAGYRLEKEGWGTMHPVTDAEGEFAGIYYVVQPGGKTEWSGIAVVEREGKKKIRPQNYQRLEDAFAALAELGEFAQTKEGRETVERMSDKAEQAGL